jgi:hypothetical protein
MVGASVADPSVQQQVKRHAQQGLDAAGEIALEATGLVGIEDVADGVGVAAHVVSEVAGGVTSGGAELAGEALGAVAEGAGGLLAGAFELIGGIFEALC